MLKTIYAFKHSPIKAAYTSTGPTLWKWFEIKAVYLGSSEASKATLLEDCTNVRSVTAIVGTGFNHWILDTAKCCFLSPFWQKGIFKAEDWQLKKQAHSCGRVSRWTQLAAAWSKEGLSSLLLKLLPSCARTRIWLRVLLNHALWTLRTGKSL